jgi:hypothetical protein
MPAVAGAVAAPDGLKGTDEGTEVGVGRCGAVLLEDTAAVPEPVELGPGLRSIAALFKRGCCMSAITHGC